MAYKTVEQGTTNLIYCETADDLPNVPKSEINFGSAAVILETAQIYIANSKIEWVPFGANLGGEGD